MKPWLKAGLIGAVAIIALNLLGTIQALSCITNILMLVVYLGIGVLATLWMNAPRAAGKAAGQGALAGLLASAIGGLSTIIIYTISFMKMDPNEIMQAIPQQSLDQMAAAGMDPQQFVGMLSGPGAGVGFGALCCGGWIIMGVLLALVAAAITGAIKSE